MKRINRGSWWGWTALFPTTFVLLYIAATLHVAAALHRILLITVIVFVAILALVWSEKHTDLMGSEGADAQAEQEALAAAGCEPGRFAPAQTARQAHYRSIMLVRSVDRSDD